MQFGKTRKEMTDQIRETGERVSSGIAAVLGVALLALAVAVGALITSLHVLKAVRA